MNSQLDFLDKFDILRFGTKFYFVFNRIFEGLIFASFRFVSCFWFFLFRFYVIVWISILGLFVFFGILWDSEVFSQFLGDFKDF